MSEYAYNPLTGNLDRVGGSNTPTNLIINTNSGSASAVNDEIDIIGENGIYVTGSGSEILISLFQWNRIDNPTTSVNAIVSNAYIVNTNTLVTFTLPAPANAPLGSRVKIIGYDPNGSWKILPGNTTQQLCIVGSRTTPNTGYLQSTSPYSSIELISTGVDWLVESFTGNPIIA